MDKSQTLNHTSAEQTYFIKMTYNYYFDSDERDYTIKPPRMTLEEIDELNNNDENWFKYMMNKETVVYENDDKNYIYSNHEIDTYEYDSDDYETDEYDM